MSMFDRTLEVAQIEAVREMVARIIAAEESLLTDEQRENPRAYLHSVWLECAAIVMAKLPSKYSIERLQPRPDIHVPAEDEAVPW